MTKRTLAIALVASVLVVIPAGTAGANGTTLADCEADLVEAGFNPGDFTTISFGTDGDDSPGSLGAGQAYCGFGGDDSVSFNRGTFLGGGGDDTVAFNQDSSVFNGGGGDDTLSFNQDSSVFNGGGGGDTVNFNQDSSVFNGGGGRDTVNRNLGGSCVDVEVGC